MAPIADAYCPVHTGAPALDLCSYCGRFTCDACTVRRQGSVYCARCMSRLAFSEGGRAPVNLENIASVLVYCAAMLGMIGIVIPPLGPVALTLGVWEFFRIRRGRSPVGGRFLVRTALVTGTLSTGICLYLLSLALERWG
jgi:hypothetical protein